MADFGTRGPDKARGRSDSDDDFLVIDDRPLHEQLGIEVHYLPDEESPPVDQARLLAFVRRELPAVQNAEVIHLVATFRPWLRAWADVLRREAFGPHSPP